MTHNITLRDNGSGTFDINFLAVPTLTSTYSIDTVLQKLGMTINYSSDVLLQSLGLLNEYSTDTALLKANQSAYIIDVIQKGETKIDSNVWSKKIDKMILTARLTNQQLETLRQKKGKSFGLTDGLYTYTVIIDRIEVNAIDSLDHPWEAEVEMFITHYYILPIPIILMDEPEGSDGGGYITIGWLSDWQYRKSHVINSAAGAGTLYQMKVKVFYGSGTDSGENVYLSGKCRTDFGDIRFTDDDGVNLLDYWMEEKVDDNYAVFWVEVADDLSSVAQMIYIYYGKADTTTSSNGSNTFLLFDHFLGTSLDTNLWVVTGSGSYFVSNSHLVINSDKWIGGIPTFGIGKRMKTRTHIGLSSTTAPIGIFLNRESSGVFAADQCAIFTAIDSERKRTIAHGISMTSVSYWIVFANSTKNLEILWQSDNVKYLQNESLMATHPYPFVPTVNLRAGFFNFSTEGRVLVTDWVFISKYVDPEPTHGAWGLEEQE